MVAEMDKAQERIAAYAVCDINSVPRRFNVTVHVMERSGKMVRIIQHDCRSRAECPAFAQRFAESEGAVAVFKSEKNGLPMPPKEEMIEAPLSDRELALWRVAQAAANFLHYYAGLPSETLDKIAALLAQFPPEGAAVRIERINALEEAFKALGVTPALVMPPGFFEGTEQQEYAVAKAIGWREQNTLGFNELMRIYDRFGLLTDEMRREWLPDDVAEAQREAIDQINDGIAQDCNEQSA